MDYFTNANTNGLTDEQLKKMNEIIIELGANELDEYFDSDRLKHLKEKVFQGFA